jgi:hypothetical protein
VIFFQDLPIQKHHVLIHLWSKSLNNDSVQNMNMYLKVQTLRIVSDSQKKKKHQAQNEENVLQYRFFFCKQKASTKSLNDHDEDDAIQQESFGNAQVQHNFK